MALENNSELKQRITAQSRGSSISYALLRNAMSKKLGLNNTDFEALDLLFYKGVVAPSELSKYTGLSSGSTTIMIDRLEKSGLVRRENNPKDRRGTLVVINTETAHKFRPLFTSLRVAQNALLDSYSSQELAVLADYFSRSASMFDEERNKVDAS